MSERWRRSAVLTNEATNEPVHYIKRHIPVIALNNTHPRSQATSTTQTDNPPSGESRIREEGKHMNSGTNKLDSMMKFNLDRKF